MGKKSGSQKISLLNEHGKSNKQIVKVDWYKQSNLAMWDKNSEDDLASGGCEQSIGRISSLELAMVRKEDKKQDQLFSAYMTKTRLSGFCKVVLIQSINGYFDLELFDLHFDQRGVANHKITQTIYQEDVSAFLSQGQYEPITYQQALILIRDASLQNYKYNCNVEVLEANKSIHLQRATYRKMQDDQGLFYLETELTKEEVVNCYFKAIQNKDGSLIYELLSQKQKDAATSKDLFVFAWNHELEDIGFIKSNNAFQEENLTQYRVTAFILGLDYQKRLIQIELDGTVVKEVGGYKIGQFMTTDTQMVAKDKMLNSTTPQQLVGVFEVEDVEKVNCYLQTQQHIVLSGEFAQGVCYKWLKDQDVLQDGINLDAQYFVQMILTQKQLLVYSANLFHVNEALSLLEMNLSKAIFLVLKCTDDIGQLYRSTLLEKGLYPQSLQKLEMQYYCSGEHYQALLKLCFRVSKMHSFHYTNEAVGFYQQVGGDCFEVLFQAHYVLINCFSKTIEEAAEVFQGKGFRELCDYIVAHSQNYRRLPKNVERLPHLGAGRTRVNKVTKIRESN